MDGAELGVLLVFLVWLDLEELAAEEAATSSAGLTRLIPGMLI